MEYHQPVLLKKTAEFLGVRPGGVYVDATVGGGGHAREILERSAPGGRLLGIDRDPMALEAAGKNLAAFGQRLVLRQGDFRGLSGLAGSAGFAGADGVLFDLGVSSAQIDRAERGFSFQADGPLDMRMGREGPTAGDLLKHASEQELAELIFRYGQERQARRIARSIVRSRGTGPMASTSDLRRAVLATRPAMPQKTLARVFQAMRIAVNDELGSLEQGLESALGILVPGGRLAVISYHSLEDSIVKDFMRRKQHPCTCPPKLAACVCGALPSLRVLTPKPVGPDEVEKSGNPRSRSARLRAAEKI